jgi:hypothetical protein
MTSIFFQIEDDFMVLENGDNLDYLENGRQSQSSVNGR